MRLLASHSARAWQAAKDLSGLLINHECNWKSTPDPSLAALPRTCHAQEGVVVVRRSGLHDTNKWRIVGSECHKYFRQMQFNAWVYILTNRSHTVLYAGFTTDCPRRMWEHRTKQNPDSFTARYNVNKLVYYQGFLSVTEAMNAEKYIKGKKRDWKKELITKMNPKWKDLITQLESSVSR